MRSISLFFSVAMLFALSNCNNDTANKNQPKAETPAPLVGGDSDEHGCKASAGYTWSALRGECIRLFEVGVRLNPVAANLDQSLSAFAVFKSAADEAQVEIYVPGEDKPRLLDKTSDNGLTVWKDKAFTLTKEKGKSVLKNVDNATLYQE